VIFLIFKDDVVDQVLPFQNNLLASDVDLLQIWELVSV